MTCETTNCPEQPCEVVNANLRVYSRTVGGTVLQWDLTVIPQLRTWEPPIEVAIEYAHAGIEVDRDTPVVDISRVGVFPSPLWNLLSDFQERDDIYVVPRQLQLSGDFNLYYRLRFRSGDNQLQTRPVSMFSGIPARFRPVYLTLLRRWYGSARNQEIASGMLLKKRRWGAYCPYCRDRDGGQQIRSQCVDCFDTGFLGGYHLADPCYYARQDPQQEAVQFDLAKGHVQTPPMTRFQFLNIPQVYPGDVWVDLQTDERWLIGSPLVTDAGIAHVELFRTAPVTRIEAGHVIYHFPISVAPPNLAPTNITLTPTTIPENAGANATVGVFTTTDPNAEDTFTYRLVTGRGSTDNAAFHISGNSLRANANFDYATKSSYLVRVRSTDQDGLFFEKLFTIRVTTPPKPLVTSTRLVVITSAFPNV